MGTSTGPAFSFDATRLPVLIVEVRRASSDAEHREYLDTLLRFYNQNDVIAVVFDVQTHDLPSFSQQRAQGEWMKQHKATLAARGVGVAFVFPSAPLRFVLSTILLIQRMPHDYTVVGAREEAIAWARGRLDARKLRRA